MSKAGPIILVEDDPDDQHLFEDACKALVIFRNGEEALIYLQTTTADPFIIFCDVNMPRMDGLQLRFEINRDEYLRRKSIPFVFFSTTAGTREVEAAYDMCVQGFFEKSHSFQALKGQLLQILNYWRECKHPKA